MNSKTSEVTPQTNDVMSQTSDVTTTNINTDDVGEKKQWSVQGNYMYVNNQALSLTTGVHEAALLSKFAIQNTSRTL